MQANNQFRGLVLDVLRAGDSLQTAAIQLQKMAATMPFASFNNAVANIIGQKYVVKPHPSRKGGLLTFAKDTAAEQRFKRILKLHPMAKRASNRPEQVPVRARVVKAIADKVVASIADAGLTRAELQALLKAVKDGVSFE